jgi:hypothetical protein
MRREGDHKISLPVKIIKTRSLSMATEKQARMIRAKQYAVGGKLSSMKQLAPMSHRTVQVWLSMLESGINPYDKAATEAGRNGHPED